ncbi:9199_t:CDS:2, partial [Entrophospora sp. SA101]
KVDFLQSVERNKENSKNKALSGFCENCFNTWTIVFTETMSSYRNISGKIFGFRLIIKFDNDF